MYIKKSAFVYDMMCWIWLKLKNLKKIYNVYFCKRLRKLILYIY